MILLQTLHQYCLVWKMCESVHISYETCMNIVNLYLIIKELRFLPKFSCNIYLNDFALPPNPIIHRLPLYRFVVCCSGTRWSCCSTGSLPDNPRRRCCSTRSLLDNSCSRWTHSPGPWRPCQFLTLSLRPLACSVRCFLLPHPERTWSPQSLTQDFVWEK
jgi:hypothetical protein